jgi:hypothetical protein
MAARQGTLGQNLGVPGAERDEPTCTEWLLLSGEMAVGGWNRTTNHLSQKDGLPAWGERRWQTLQETLEISRASGNAPVHSRFPSPTRPEVKPCSHATGLAITPSKARRAPKPSAQVSGAGDAGDGTRGGSRAAAATRTGKTSHIDHLRHCEPARVMKRGRPAFDGEFTGGPGVDVADLKP